MCEGCKENVESGEEILKCVRLGENEEHIGYDLFYSEMVRKQIQQEK